MGSVVIIYEEPDFVAARDLARELEIAGFATWYRWRDGCVGPSFVGQCERRIAEADAVLAIVSRPLDPGRTRWVDDDIQTACKHRRTVVIIARAVGFEEISRRPPAGCEPAARVRLAGAGVRGMLPELIEALARSGVEPHVREELPAELAERVNRLRLPAVADVFASIIDDEVARTIPREAAVECRAIPLDNVGEVVVVAVCDPAVIERIRDRYFPFSHGIEPVLATEESILDAIARTFGEVH